MGLAGDTFLSLACLLWFERKVTDRWKKTATDFNFLGRHRKTII